MPMTTTARSIQTIQSAKSIAAAQERHVREAEIDHIELGHERDQRRDQRLPPVMLFGMMGPEVHDDRQRDERLGRQDDDHAHDREQAVDAEIGLAVRVVPALLQRIDHDDERRDRALGERGHMRRPVHRMGLAERSGKQAFAAERIEVAGRGVVEGHAAGERAGQDQDAHQHGDPAADELRRRREEEVAGVVLRHVDRIVELGVAREGGPGDQRVEDAESDAPRCTSTAARCAWDRGILRRSSAPSRIRPRTRRRRTGRYPPPPPAACHGHRSP